MIALNAINGRKTGEVGMTKYKVGTQHKRKSKKAKCGFCGEWGQTQNNPQDYICADCIDFFKREMSDAVHETAKQFRKEGWCSGNDGNR